MPRLQNFLLNVFMYIHNNLSSERIMQILWAESALLPTGWAANVRIVIGNDGRIGDVQQDTPAQGTRVGMLLPSPVNAHSHAFQRAMAGLT